MAKRIVLPIWLVAIFFFFLFPVGGDGDFWHHLNTGRYVSELLSLPKEDEYTFTAEGGPWVGYAWGAGVILYQTYNRLGPIGINILVALIAVLTFGLLYYYIKSLGVSKKIAIFCLTMAAPIIAIRWPPRPEIFSYPLLMFILIIDILRKNRPNFVFFYPLIILVWANVYGSSVLVGVALVILLFVKQFLKEKTYAWPSLLTVPAAFINGYGVKTVFYLWFIPQITHQNSEWGWILRGLGGPIDYQILFQYRLLLYLFYLGVFCLTFFLSFRVIRTKPFLFLGAMIIFIPIFIYRQLALAAILSIPSLAIAVDSANLSKKKALWVVGGIFILISIPLSLWIATRGLGQEDEPFSPRLIGFIKANGLEGRALNNQQIGAFLTYHLFPEVRVFTDTRDDLFIGTSALTDFSETFAGGNSVLPLLEKYKPDIVVGDLADGASYQPIFYSDEWAVVYLNETYFIAIPKRVADAKGLPQFSAIDPFTFTGAKEGQEELAISQYKEIGTSDENSWNGRMRLGLLYFGLKKYDMIINMLSTLEPPKNPRAALFHADLDYILTQAYFAQGDCEYTKKYLDKTNEDITHKFIFSPARLIPSLVDKGYTFYYLVCERDIVKAEAYLRSYLSKPGIDPAEIESTQKQYDQVITQQSQD
jgi:hypothetical protein